MTSFPLQIIDRLAKDVSIIVFTRFDADFPAFEFNRFDTICLLSSVLVFIGGLARIESREIEILLRLNASS